jgi:hypothetical protein
MKFSLRKQIVWHLHSTKARDCVPVIITGVEGDLRGFQVIWTWHWHDYLETPQGLDSGNLSALVAMFGSINLWPGYKQWVNASVVQIWNFRAQPRIPISIYSVEKNDNIFFKMLCIENFQKYICQNKCIGTKVMHIQIINVYNCFCNRMLANVSIYILKTSSYRGIGPKSI